MQKASSIELGPYQLLERIGEGGSGQIYRAKGPDGFVAVKLLGPAADLDEAARARFGRELAALRALQHPSLVALLDHGFDDELGPYLVLELLAGKDLRLGPMCPEAALLLALPVAEAVAALHAAGYVHRDLKPENAIAEPDGTVTVIDLGLAWRSDMTRHTDTGAAVGSVGYMAPEQIEGRTVDGSVDIYALGVMIYEWIVGARPFARARPAEEAAAMLVGAHAKLDAADRRASPELAALVEKCLSSTRPTAGELVEALRAQIDWTDDLPGERAAAIADPASYQQKVAAFRVRRIERLAQAAPPFEAIALCDRGLAYAPDHAGLLAIVANAEQQLGKPAAPVAAKSSHAWLVATAVGIAGGVALIYFLIPERHPRRAAVEVTRTSGSAGDQELAGTLIDMLGTAMTSHSDPAPASDGQEPTTARGWLKRAQSQPPVDAAVSARHALALNPGWPDAEVALCVALAAARDPGALEPCNVALKDKPNDRASLAARGRAKITAGDAEGAVHDLDKLVALDPDPAWRHLRAQARAASGDTVGAAKDLADACSLGDGSACAPK